jgi:hypothetical protein
MPQLIEHIDAIARQRQRDVLFLRFCTPEDAHFDYEGMESRKRILQFFERESIPWQQCADVASVNSMSSYAGQIFIDVRFDESDPLYQKVQAFIEHPDGTVRFSDVNFYVVGLEYAMKNAHHDEPGFWEKWAENF